MPANTLVLTTEEHHRLAILNMIEYNFEKQHHTMQETCNNCFESKNVTTLHQAKTGKHECRTTIVSSRINIMRPFFRRCWTKIVLSRKDVTRPFFKQKQVSVNAKIHSCYISAIVLKYFWLMKGHVTFFQLKTITASFLHLLVLFFKVINNHTVVLTQGTYYLHNNVIE